MLSKLRPKRIKIHTLSYVLISVAVLAAATVMVVSLIKNWQEDKRQADFQASIQPFYNAPSPLPSTTPGSLIRSEKMDIAVPQGGSAYRILYVSETPSGNPAVSSGIVFLPPESSPKPEGGRKVIAWAHGTLGFGNECTPSRSMDDTLNDTQAWLGPAMQRGYVVAATDYVGVGTSGERYYLVGKSEARDVLNSIRAARQLKQTNVGTDFVTWGHSQGGHSSLFAAIEAKSYAPELTLHGAAAAAPAAELESLFSEQYNAAISWGIGPAVALSWPNIYPELQVRDVLTDDALKNYKQIASECVQQAVLGLEIRGALGSNFFRTDPMKQESWQQAALQQTPDLSKIPTPIYVAQGLTDQVVLPNTTALLAQKACAQQANIYLNWLGNVDHQLTAITSGPSAIAWMQDRFSGAAAPNSCSQVLPVSPASQ